MNKFEHVQGAGARSLYNEVSCSDGLEGVSLHNEVPCLEEGVGPGPGDDPSMMRSSASWVMVMGPPSLSTPVDRHTQLKHYLPQLLWQAIKM